MDTLTYPDSQQVSYTYDNLNRVKTTQYPGMGIVTDQYSVSENRNEYDLKYTSINAQQSHITDALGELQSHNHTYSESDTTGWYTSYQYDEFGNINNYGNPQGNYNFEYDGVNRIKKETLPSATKDYTYDSRGNRQTLTSTDTLSNTISSGNFTYNALNQLQSTNDNAGTQANYTYYGDGLRASKTVTNPTNGTNKTQYVYLNGKIIEELDGNGNMLARNIWGNELLYRKDYAANRGGFYFYNGHGDVVKIIDANGSGDVLKTYDYDIWGNVTTQTSHPTKGFNNAFKYTGEMQDDETGFIYLRARYYDPSIGRFINEDTYEGKIDNPLSLNLYTYVGNNPLRFIDPTGHMEVMANGDSGGYVGEESTPSIFSISNAWEGVKILGGMMKDDAVAAGSDLLDIADSYAMSNPIAAEGEYFAVKGAEYAWDGVKWVKTAITGEKAVILKFGSDDLLSGHFIKHNGEFKGTFKNAEEYLAGANDVIRNGIKVSYNYKGEVRTGFVRFMGNSSKKGEAKFEFVGTNNARNITTYHVESGDDFWKMLNGDKSIKVLNPVDGG